MINGLIRIRYKKLFIQAEKDKSGEFTAWSSNKPSSSVMESDGDVYFNFGKTAQEAIEKVASELDTLGVAQ